MTGATAFDSMVSLFLEKLAYEEGEKDLSIMENSMTVLWPDQSQSVVKICL
jgi:hypothetical protein